jgi:hypothetical protein
MDTSQSNRWCPALTVFVCVFATLRELIQAQQEAVTQWRKKASQKSNRTLSISKLNLKLETRNFKLISIRGPIAQSVEQLAFNQWVAGSSPARLTTSKW